MDEDSTTKPPPEKRQRPAEETAAETEAAQQHPQNANKDICAMLLELGETERNRGHVAKYHVYARAAAAIGALPTRVRSGADARRLPGVGAKIAAKVDEILATGALRRLETARADPRTAAINLVSRVPGVGPAAARRLVDGLGVRSLADLRAHEAALTQFQRVGLRFLHDFELRVPRAEVAAAEARVRAAAADVDVRLRCEAVGSFRRGLPSSGDVDVLVTHPEYTQAWRERCSGGSGGRRGEPFPQFAQLVQRLVDTGFIVATMALGPMQFNGACRLPSEPGQPENHVRRLDLKLFPVESFHCGLLHFTGSAEHNIRMSTAALARGFQLNEYSLTPIGATGVKGEPFPISSEEDIFSILGLPYRAPHERNA